MMLKGLRDVLSAYPERHPSPVHFEYIEEKHGQATVGLSHTPCVVDDLLSVLAERGTPDVFTVVLNTPDDDSLIDPTATLLRAWLGPVPVVLPEGCSVEGGVRLFRADPYVAAVWMTEGYYSISEKGRHVMRLTPEALHWLRTGEVAP